MAFTLVSSEKLGSFIEKLNNNNEKIIVQGNANQQKNVLVIGIEGAVGAGKTDLINYLSQISPPDNATIIFQREDIASWLDYPTKDLPGTFSETSINLLQCNALNRQFGIYENMSQNMAKAINVLNEINDYVSKPNHLLILVVERGTEGSTFLTNLDERNKMLTVDEMNHLIDQQNYSGIPSDKKILLDVPMEESVKKANDSVSKTRIEDIWEHYNMAPHDYVEECHKVRWYKEREEKFNEVRLMINRFGKEFRARNNPKKYPGHIKCPYPWCDV